jgi:hypothetical protein
MLASAPRVRSGLGRACWHVHFVPWLRSLFVLAALGVLPALLCVGALVLGRVSALRSSGVVVLRVARGWLYRCRLVVRWICALRVTRISAARVAVGRLHVCVLLGRLVFDSRSLSDVASFSGFRFRVRVVAEFPSGARASDFCGFRGG